MVYEGFLRDLSLPQLKHLSRYLKAVKLRLERLDIKDAQQAAQLAPLWEAYWQRRQTLTSPPEEFLKLL